MDAPGDNQVCRILWGQYRRQVHIPILTKAKALTRLAGNNGRELLADF
jgi:hypothetical protein